MTHNTHNARHIVLYIIGYITHATAGAAYRSAAVKVERSGSEERSAVNERSGSERGVTATDAAATNQRNSQSQQEKRPRAASRERRRGAAAKRRGLGDEGRARCDHVSGGEGGRR